MIYTMDDIEKLLKVAKPKEREELATLLDYEFDGMTPHSQAQELTKQLCWKYQTPVGYLTRWPTFDEICVDVAKRLNLKGLVKQNITCWQLLERVVRNMLETMLDGLTDEQKEKLEQAILQDEQLRGEIQRKGGDWSKVGAGSALLAIQQLGGFATYKIAVIVANQMARILLGRGLTLAANAALTRMVSIALGPVGWLLLLWGLNDLLGTNYKRVIPATFYVFCIYARLREEGDLPFET